MYVIMYVLAGKKDTSFTNNSSLYLEPVCCKKQQKSLRNTGALKDLNDSKLIV